MEGDRLWNWSSQVFSYHRRTMRPSQSVRPDGASAGSPLPLVTEVAGALSAAGSEKDVLAALNARALPALGASGGALALTAPGSPVVRTVALGDLPDGAPDAGEPFSDLPGLLARVARTGQATAGTGPIVVVPVRVGPRLLGSLGLLLAEGAGWSADDGQLLDLLAVLVGQAVERLAAIAAATRADEAAVSSAQRLALVNEVSDVFARDTAIDDAVMELARVVVPALADWCTITLAPSGGEQRTVGWAHRDPAKVDALARYARVQAASMNSEAAVAVSLRTGTEVVTVIPPLDQWVGPVAAQDLLRQVAPRSVAVLPLSAGGRTLGAMALVSVSSTQPLGPDQLATAREVARRAGLALDNLRLRDRAALLARVTDQVSSTLDAGQAVGRLARLVAPALADWCIVSLVEDDDIPDPLRRVRDVGTWHVDPRLRSVVDGYSRARLAAAKTGAYVQRALDTGEPVLIPAPAVDSIRAVMRAGAAFDLIGELAPEHAAIFPLRARGRIVGLLTLFNGEARGLLTPEDLSSATEVAARAALALDNARLYRQQRDLATTLQRSLLTPPVQPPGLGIAVRYQPAGSQAQVGGDWYDSFTLPDGGLAVVVGDVVGHDRDAAAQMAQLRNVLRGVASAGGGSPAEDLGRLDSAMERLPVDTMATAVVCHISAPDERSGPARVLSWSNAGHPAPLLIDPDGTASLLTTKSDLLLGVDPGAVRADHRLLLAPGSTFVLYTDGLIERRDQSLDDGERRLLAVASELGGMSPEEVSDALIDELATGAEDDIALLVLRS